MKLHPLTRALPLLITFLAFCAPLGATEIKRDILGLRLNMTKSEAEARLKEIGTFVRDERKGQQIWELRDERFSHLIFGADNEGRIRFVTVVAREGEEAKRVRYSEIGDTNKARQAGDPAIKNFNYEWSAAAGKDTPEMLVMARGRHEEFLSTYSIKRVGDVKDGKDAKNAKEDRAD